MFIIKNEDGAMRVSVTPEGIKLLAAFAACVGRGGYAPLYRNSLDILESAPNMTDDEVNQWVEEYEEELRVAQQEFEASLAA